MDIPDTKGLSVTPFLNNYVCDFIA